MSHTKDPLTRNVLANLTLLLAVTLSGSLLAAEKSVTQTKAVELTLDASSTVVLETSRNGFPARTKLTATEPYPEYNLTPVVDGIKQRKDLGWQEAAWASAEDETAHGIEVQFSQPQRGGRFQVTWAYDVNSDDKVRWWVSRDYIIQVKEKASDTWKTVIEVKNNQSVVGSYPLPETPFSYVRICQLAGGGHPLRPNLMWVGQLELVKD